MEGINMNPIDGFIELEENIETTIYEGTLKLGYNKEESFSIYYDLDLLNYLLYTNFNTKEACFNYLTEFQEYVKSRLSNIAINLEKGRFKITVPKEGISYIYTKNEDNTFLKELINTVKSHAFTLEDILQIFRHYSNNFACEQIDNEEFQYVIYFKDNTLDKFKYCFTFDQMGGYYHRLLDYSYSKLMEE